MKDEWYCSFVQCSCECER